MPEYKYNKQIVLKHLLFIMYYNNLDKGPVAMELSPPPLGLEAEYEALFTSDSLHFLHELISTFDKEVDEVRKLKIDFQKCVNYTPCILFRFCGYECLERPTSTFQVSCLIFLKVAPI